MNALRWTAGRTAALTLTLLCTGCAGGDALAPSAPAPAAVTPTTSTAAGQENEDGELETLGPLGELSEADRAAASQRATDFLTALANTDRDAGTWWAEVSPFLTPEAAEDYSYVDPVEIPPFTLTGEASTELPGATSSVVQFNVPTSMGGYTITLTRVSADQPWRVGRADPPAGQP